MKINNLILMVFILSGSVLSQALVLTEDPGNFCEKPNSYCTVQMKEISNFFKKSGVTFTAKELSGFTGDCYYLNSPYDPKKVQYATFLFENDADGLKADGIFSFNFNANPYSHFTELGLKEEFSNRGYVLKPVVVENNMVELSYTEKFLYWFRSDESANHLYMIARQGGINSDSLAFCSLKKLASD
jgi:hypothetical protein